MKKKKLDIFNLFYSGAAVVILIGVIAKLLEWPAQDILITGGLAIEALVFGVSAFKYVEVEEKHEGATEATLAKVAEGLGGLKGVAGEGGNAETYINIQSETSEQYAPQVAGTIHASQEVNRQQSVTVPNQSSVAIEVKATTPPTINAAHSLWQLEQMDILSLAKDLFFQPEWDKLSTEEYVQISNLFKRVFDKKLPNKEALPFLLQFPVKLPIPEMSKLSLSKAEIISLEEMDLLCKAFSIIKYSGFFDHFVVEQEGDQVMMRPKKANETQVFGGEEDLIIQHVKQFYSKDLIISPNIECIAGMIRLKGTLLIEQLINKLNIQSESEFISINQILLTQSDDLKKKLFSRVKKLKYNLATATGYSYLKTLVQSALSFKDNSIGQSLFNNVIEIQIDDQNTITLDDVVNCYADTIYFGPKNEYSVVLSEIFVNGELNNLNHVNSIIEKLITDNVASKSRLLEVFNLKEQDSKKDVFTKLNYHLNKTNTTPSGAQLAFILLYKQYS